MRLSRKNTLRLQLAPSKHTSRAPISQAPGRGHRAADGRGQVDGLPRARAHVGGRRPRRLAAARAHARHGAGAARVANVLRQLRLLAEHEVDDANAGVHGVLTRTSQLLELAASHARGVGATVRAEALRLAQRRFEAAAAALAAAPAHATWAVAMAGSFGSILERMSVGWVGGRRPRRAACSSTSSRPSRRPSWGRAHVPAGPAAAADDDDAFAAARPCYARALSSAAATAAASSSTACSAHSAPRWLRARGVGCLDRYGVLVCVVYSFVGTPIVCMTLQDRCQYLRDNTKLRTRSIRCAAGPRHPPPTQRTPSPVGAMRASSSFVRGPWRRGRGRRCGRCAGRGGRQV